MVSFRALVGSAAIIGVGVAGYAILSPQGLSQRQQLAAQAEALKDQNRELAEKAAKLEKEAQLLSGEDQGSKAHLEKTVREELGYVRPDEKVLQLSPPGEAAGSTQPDAATQDGP
jgi:cell division protein FtsB